MPLEIRQLTRDEAPLLRRLRLAALRESPDQLGESIEAARARTEQGWADAAPAAYVAFLDGEPSAMVYAFSDPSDASIARLGGMWVAPDARRNGIGLALVRAVRDWAHANAARCVQLWVVPDSAAARLYERAGFVATGAKKAFSATDARRVIALEQKLDAMNLREEYQRQFALRSWPQIFDELPLVTGQRVLDLGCGIGDQAAELAARGARVLGLDANDELLAAARARNIPQAEFRSADLRERLPIDHEVNGIWSSFAAAYFPDLDARIETWTAQLEPGGWIALVEIDDLFGHEPIRSETKALLDAYARESLAANRYDFFMGRKLVAHLERAGLRVQKAFTVPDRELAFDGPASAEVLDSWRARLNRMKALQAFCGESFDAIRTDFLAALAHSDHSCRAAVQCSVAIR